MRMTRINMATTMIVCVCHRVSDRDIARAVQGGCRSFDELQDDLRVATGCGACRECALECYSGELARIELKRAAAAAPQDRSACNAATTMLAASTSK